MLRVLSSLFEQSVEQFTGNVGQARLRGAEEEHRGAREAPRCRTVTRWWMEEAATKSGFCWDGTREQRTLGPDRATSQGGWVLPLFPPPLSPLHPPLTPFYLTLLHTYTPSILRPPLSSSHLPSPEYPSPLQLTEAAALRKDPSIVCVDCLDLLDSIRQKRRMTLKARKY